MTDAQKILELYFVTNKLKTVLRQGWINWQVEDARVESIAEHIYGTLMLAVSICANTNQNIDLYKVALMLALHEVEEIIIGDIAFFDIEKAKTKKQDGTAYGAGEMDYRGRIPVGPNQGYLAKDSGYREEIIPVAILDLTCNETGKGATKEGCFSGSWSGNYRITEIWPLSQVVENGVNTPQWAATEGLKFKLDEGNYIEEGESKKMIFPADADLVVALKQPDRLTKGEREAKPDFTGNEDWYDDVKDYQTNGELHDDFWWCIRKSFPKHTTLPVDSYNCNYRFVLSANHLYAKSALGATYIIDEADIVDGSSEK